MRGVVVQPDLFRENISLSFSVKLKVKVAGEEKEFRQTQRVVRSGLMEQERAVIQN